MNIYDFSERPGYPGVPQTPLSDKTRLPHDDSGGALNNTDQLAAFLRIDPPSLR